MSDETVKGEWKGFSKSLFANISANDVTGLAAQIAYYFLLSLFPLLIFIVTLLPYLPFEQGDILGLVRDFAPGETMSMIEETLQDVMSNRNSGLLSVSIIATIWSASNGMNAIVKSLNRAYDVEETRSFIATRLMSILLTFAMILVFVIALLLPVFGKQIGLFLFSQFGFSDQFLTIWNGIRWAITPIILFIIFVGLYYFAPSKRIKCLSAFPGAIFATLGWVLASLAFSYYVGSYGNYSATYGSIGGIIVLMIWFYLTGIIIMIGGEINALVTIKDKDSC
ncbi:MULTISPECIES: YihY/virulence factor BrkB family protein [Rossellomorea]|jgi:membrane protein|uniref:YihY family inner membrane protein n=1 Tax=Rossellomorea vietnamensis TaxID=218284 RepID=A0A6I6UNT7_9BACI|nr:MULTISPECIES: YihY/virulence factor BrkB family protein [Rossellomorea]OXS64375.1 ribonuclease [Bacillus sp. DSM 27956]PRX79513.1 membrane protein [Bacillus sp. V-88]MCC5804620.1 YihY/virulence factor BrkB family protein [Rossellomorea vietnamensis]QHE60160.1 YihY family inner membrane protein [Rossellomorea vietnamensis]WGG46211.1 YihY/virulence factor BrkB family protein [Rossellomorea sp. DA94]